MDRQDYATEAEEWADLIADNRIAELAEINNRQLKDVLQELDTGAFDMDLTGFTGDALEEIMNQVYTPANIDDLLHEVDMSQAVDKPIWATIRTSAENREILDRVLAVLEQNGIKVERSYEG